MTFVLVLTRDDVVADGEIRTVPFAEWTGSFWNTIERWDEVVDDGMLGETEVDAVVVDGSGGEMVLCDCCSEGNCCWWGCEIGINAGIGEGRG